MLLFLSRIPSASRRRTAARRHQAAVRRARLAQTRALRAAIARAAPITPAPPSLRARVRAELSAAGAGMVASYSLH